MRKTFDEDVLERIQKHTGFEGDDLYTFTGVAYATAFIGRIPTKDDLEAYLGISKKTIDATIRKGIEKSMVLDGSISPLAKWLSSRKEGIGGPRPTVAEVIYPLATDLLSFGLYFGKGSEESYAHTVATMFLSSFFDPQNIESLDLFTGYNIVREYLWASITEESVISLEEFVRVRFYPKAQAILKVQDFVSLLKEQNPHMKAFQLVDTESCEYLAGEAIKLHSQLIAHGSGSYAKYRLQEKILKKIDSVSTGTT